jgi:uncharacterized protein (DUF2147 family)
MTKDCNAMQRVFSLRLLFLIAVLCGSRIYGIAQTADPIVGIWNDEDRVSKIQVYKAADNKYYGKIVWLKEPDRDGKPKTDIHNPDETKRTQPEMGLMLLKGFTRNNEKEYSDGTIYDPRSGKTYSCKIKYDEGKLNVRGYVGVSLFGKTTIWTKAE